jgi:hypothetical protein
MTDDGPTAVLPVRLENGSTIHVEVRDVGGRQKVNDLRDLSLKTVAAAIEGICGEIGNVLHRLEPQKSIVELGFEIGVESGQLTALLVKGSGKANFKITLEWTKQVSSTSTVAV